MNFEFTNFKIYIRIRNFNLQYSCQICARTDVGIEVSANETRCLCSLPAVDAASPANCRGLRRPTLFVSDYPSRPHLYSIAICRSVESMLRALGHCVRLQ